MATYFQGLGDPTADPGGPGCSVTAAPRPPPAEPLQGSGQTAHRHLVLHLFLTQKRIALSLASCSLPRAYFRGSSVPARADGHTAARRLRSLYAHAFRSCIARFFVNKFDSQERWFRPELCAFSVFGWIYTSPEEDERLVPTRPGQPRAPAQTDPR